MREKTTHATQKERERMVAVAAETPRDIVTAEESLKELADLADTAGADVCAALTQKRDRPDHSTYIGKGKIDELKALLLAEDSKIAIFDDELSPAQLRNLNKAMPDIKIIDRTLLILDIFAARAQTRENAAQVELAQLKYSLSRLAGGYENLSRLGGGVGTRGPGETKLETDRRKIRDKINALNKDLEQIGQKRDTMRKQRQKAEVPVVSLVGYTNAGKSTILNMMTRAGVLEEDKLFATLDTTTRRMRTRAGVEFLLTDTIGFIRKLPHHLVKAFRATLEELNYSDVLLHIVDASDPSAATKMATVYDTLAYLRCGDKPVVTVFNKTDKARLNGEGGFIPPADERAFMTRLLSAKTTEGKEDLIAAIETALAINKL